MTSTLQRLDDWLRTNRGAFYSLLRPGASARDLDGLERALGFELPGGLRALLSWRDGQDAAACSFVYSRSLMTCSEIAERSRTLRSLLEAGDFHDRVEWWNTGWIPLLSSGADDLLCVDTSGSFGGRAGQLLEFWHDDADRDIIAPDFDAWLSAIVGSFEADLWMEIEGDLRPVSDDALADFLRSALAGYPVEASAKKSDAKAKKRIDAREAIRHAFHALEGPRSDLTKKIDPGQVAKAAQPWVSAAMDKVVRRRASAKVEGVYEVLAEPKGKKVAYVVWSTSTVGDGWKDGIVVGFDLKGNDIYKEVKVHG